MANKELLIASERFRKALNDQKKIIQVNNAWRQMALSSTAQRLKSCKN